MSTVKVVVEIELTEGGELRTSHQYASPEDAQTLSSWPSGGIVHLAHALFIEALRRETYAMALTQLSTGTDPGELEAKEVEGLTRAQVAGLLDRFAPETAEAVVKMIRD
jgi:hypothetical protein